MKNLFIEIPLGIDWMPRPLIPVQVGDDELREVPEGSRIIPFTSGWDMCGATVGTTPQGEDFYLDTGGQVIYFQELGG